ncbi:HU family DNA-binding protein [Acidithiobacillus sp.]|uniref:HU family DNA-binding protein n=2 Tax=Acidithiobacillus sp. TaxID=1872118 RepID=UPI003D02351A
MMPLSPFTAWRSDMTVIKQDLTRHLLDAVGLIAKDCAAVVNAMFDTIRMTLAAGENVKLSGFGNFTLHEKRARPGRTLTLREGSDPNRWRPSPATRPCRC